MKDGKKHGKGKIVWGPKSVWAGNTYEGDYVNDIRTGHGVYTYANGNRYEGQFKDNEKHGKGKMVWGPKSVWAGNIYEGDYVNDVRTGHGVYTYANGDRYEMRYSQITSQ